MTFQPDVLLLNVQHLNVDKINYFELEYLSEFKLNFLCLTETWSCAASVHSWHFDNFELNSFYCRSQFNGGGVAIWARSGLGVVSVDLNRFCRDKDIEICASKFCSRDIINVILICYRSPSDDVDVFLDVLYDVLDFCIVLM